VHPGRDSRHTGLFSLFLTGSFPPRPNCCEDDQMPFSNEALALRFDNQLKFSFTRHFLHVIVAS